MTATKHGTCVHLGALHQYGGLLIFVNPSLSKRTNDLAFGANGARHGISTRCRLVQDVESVRGSESIRECTASTQCARPNRARHRISMRRRIRTSCMKSVRSVRRGSIIRTGRKIRSAGEIYFVLTACSVRQVHSFFSTQFTTIRHLLAHWYYSEIVLKE